MANEVGTPGVYGIVTLLDAGHRAVIENLWRELERRFGIPHLYDEPIVHFSYHVAENYDLGKLKPIISQFTRFKQCFKVRTEGLGVFNKSEPVVYIPVVRNPQLATFHRSLWELINPWAADPLKYYHPDSWMPHITLVHGNVPMQKLPQVVAYLAEYDFNWEIEVSNLSIICSTCTRIEADLQFHLAPRETAR